MTDTQEKINEHQRLADHFAEESHKFEGPISDALSGLAEAHQQYANTLLATAAELLSRDT